jgi:hypothetical protein
VSGEIARHRRILLDRAKWLDDKIATFGRESRQLGFLVAEVKALRHLLAGGTLDPDGKASVPFVDLLVEARDMLLTLGSYPEHDTPPGRLVRRINDTLKKLGR